MFRRAGLLALPLLLVLAAAAQARPLAAGQGVVWGGLNAQRDPVVIQLSANGRKVQLMVFSIDLKCNDGTFTQEDGYTGLTVTKAGAFHDSYAGNEQSHADGTKSVFGGSVSGKLQKATGRGSGTMRLSEDDFDAKGTQTDHCASGTVKYTVRQ